MANWRIVTLDHVILKAIANGFNDPDFEGWSDLDAETRIRCVETIVKNNNLGQFIFNKSFAKAVWGEDSICTNCGQERIHPDGICDIGYGFDLLTCDYHRQQMVVAESDDWLQYLRDHA